MDVTELESFRKKISLQKKNIKITPVSFVIKALSVALTRNPSFNSSLNSDGNEIILKIYKYRSRSRYSEWITSTSDKKCLIEEF